MIPPEKLILIMHRRNLSISELAEKSGLSTRTIYNFLHGKRNTSMQTLETLAETLGFHKNFFKTDKDFKAYEYKTLYFEEPEGLRSKKDGHIYMNFDETLNSFASNGWKIKQVIDIKTFLLEREL